MRNAPAQMACHVTGGGPPVVLLHGIPGSAKNWSAVVQELEGDFQVIVPDLVGFGDSSRPDTALWAHDQARVLEECLRELGIDHATFVAHDFGGPVAFALWERNPELFAGLLVSATNAFADTPIPFPLSTVVWPVVGGLFARAIFSAPSLRMMLKQGIAAEGVVLDPEQYIGDSRQSRTIREIFHGSLSELAERYGPFEKTLATIDVPVTVVWGDKDMFFPLEHGRRTAQAIPGAEFVVYPDTGHFIPEERPKVLAQDIMDLVVRTDIYERSSNA